MRISILLTLLSISFFSHAQTGPGGVGNSNGSSSLKIWFRPDYGLAAGGDSLVNGWGNSAGVDSLKISGATGAKPKFYTTQWNGYNAMQFSGHEYLTTGACINSSNFVTDQASSFVVSNGENSEQNGVVYGMNPLGQNNFAAYIPWADSIIFDLGNANTEQGRIQVPFFDLPSKPSLLSFESGPSFGKAIYKNGNIVKFSPYWDSFTGIDESKRLTIGGAYDEFGNFHGLMGNIGEVIIFKNRVNLAERIIVENYLTAKFGLNHIDAQDFYTMDDEIYGNYDHEVAGIGRASDGSLHVDSRGTDIVETVASASNLFPGEYLFWGHNGKNLLNIMNTDLPVELVSRLARNWRISEVGETGSLLVSFDLSKFEQVKAADLKLLIDTNNDGLFGDETYATGGVIANPADLGGNKFLFTSVTGFNNALRFTLGTTGTPLAELGAFPVEMVNFTAKASGNDVVLNWSTATESQNLGFTVEQSNDGIEWRSLGFVAGKGTSAVPTFYQFIDKKPTGSISYYRLQQQDFSGRVTASPVVFVHLEQTAVFEIYPNPSKGTMILEGALDEASTIELISVDGKTAVCQYDQIGQNMQIRVDESVPNGIYRLQVANGAQITTKIIVLQR